MAAAAFRGISMASQHLFEREVCTHWNKWSQVNNQDSLARHMQTIASQIARVSFMCSGTVKKIAVTVIILASNKNIEHGDTVSQALDYFELAFTAHAFVCTGSAYAITYLGMRGLECIAENNPTAEKIKLVVVGYFSAISRIFVSKGLELCARVVNLCFFAKIYMDRNVSLLRQNAISSPLDVVHPENLFDLPFTEGCKKLQDRAQDRMLEIFKESWLKNPMFHYFYNSKGYDEVSELLVLKTASYRVLSEQVDKGFLDSYVVGLALRDKYNFVAGWVFTKFKYSKQIVDDQTPITSSVQNPTGAIHQIKEDIIMPFYDYCCHITQRIERLLNSYFFQGQSSDFRNELENLIKALYCQISVEDRASQLTRCSLEDLKSQAQ